MKIFKGKFKFLILYFLPIFIAGVFLTYAFPEKVLFALRILLPLFFVIVIILILPPFHKKYPHTSTNPWLKLPLWWCLELAILMIFITLFLASVAGESPQTKMQALQSSAHFYLFSGFFPWSLYLLLGIAMAKGRQKNLPLIRSALLPIYHQKFDAIIGLGIDLFIKQGTFIAGAIALSVSVAYIIYSINSAFQLNSPFNQTINTMLAGSIIFLLLASAFWRRLTRYFWQNRYPFSTLLFLYTAFIIISFLVCGIILKLIIPYLPPPPSYKITFSWPTENPIVNNSLLLLLFWQILAAPWIATLFAHLLRGVSIPIAMIQALSLPALLTLGILLDHFFLHPVSMQWLTQMSFSNVLGGTIACVSLAFTLIFFHMPETLGLVQLTHKIPSLNPNLPATRNFLFLIITFLMIYLLVSLSPLILYASGIVIPVFLILCGACLSLIIGLK